MADQDFDSMLLECKITSHEWHNSSSRHSFPLISEQFVKPVEEAMHQAIAIVNSVTMPVPNSAKRYVLFKHARIYRSHEFREASDIVRSAVWQLNKNWDEAINEAKERLGELFDIAEYPDPDDLGDLYSFKLSIPIGSEINDESLRTTTLKLFESYSLLYVDPPEPDLWEAIAFGRELEEKRRRESA